MTAHELARQLLSGPDVPVVLVGEEFGDYSEVQEIEADNAVYSAWNPGESVPHNKSGDVIKII